MPRTLATILILGVVCFFAGLLLEREIMWMLFVIAGLVVVIPLGGYLAFRYRLPLLLAFFVGAMSGRTADTPPANRSTTTKLSGLLMLTCLCVNASCSSTPAIGGGPSKLTTVQQVQAVEKPAAEAAVYVNKALSLVEDIQAGKVALTMEVLAPVHEQLVQAKASIEEVNHALPEAEKTAAADAKTVTKQAAQITELKKADPVVARLNYIGIGLLLLSLAAIGAGIWLNNQMARNGGFVGSGVALTILTLAYFLHALIWIIAGVVAACVVGGVVYLILHQKVMGAIVKDAENWIPKPGSG